MRNKVIAVSMVLIALASARGLHAQQGEWQGGLRALAILPAADSGTFTDTGTGLDIGSAVSLDLHLSHRIYDDWALELALTGAEHGLETEGGSDGGLDAGDIWMAPVTVTLQYHFPLPSRYRPYVGGGVAYTSFFEYSLSDDLASLGVGSLEVSDEVGLVVQAGVSYEVGDRWFANLDLRYLRVPGDAELRLASGSVFDTISFSPDPWLVGLGAGFIF
jgi:outer membrane protein